MKNLSTLTMLFVVLASSAQVSSQIETVTVYQTRAEINRSASTQLAVGEHELVFNGVSTNVDQNNIQVKGTGDLTILGISFRKNYLNEKELPADLQKVKDEIKDTEKQLKKAQNVISSLQIQRKLLDANMSIGGTQSNLSMQELKDMAEYYQSKTLDIANSQMDLQEEINTLNESLRKLRAHYNDRTSQFRKNSGEIVVNVDAKSATKANLTLTYMVSGAGWTAEYDLRAEDIGAPLQLTYKAIVTQNTGENWENVNMTLSTGNPAISTTKPTMNPQYLDYYYPSNNKLREVSSMNRMEATGAVSRAAAPMEEAVVEMEFDDLEVGTETKTLYTNYEIERPYSLSSGGKPLTVTVRDQEVDADYEYQTIPKLRNRVFLIAKAKNWGSLVLLRGPMNIFFEGGYVGKSYMNPQTTADELPISLGYDPGITINRKLLTDVSSKKTIGTNRKETYSYEISIRNNKRQNIKVKIQDQIPVSKNTGIKVEVLDLGGAILKATTGEITWEIELNSAQEKKKKFGYEVKYPKGETISGT
ncbi:MAG: mucoidy inhibitor MuiA family protein [Cytophagales bacterium]|nr:mucoidy inhibitor MuiA family protein [Cytophagales bacterium]